MKRSVSVKLVLLGTVVTVVTGCEPNQSEPPREAQQLEIQQQMYATQSACIDDWGDTDNCKPANTSSSGTSGAHGGAYLGPRYYWDRGLGQPVVVEPSGASRVVSNSHLTPAGSSVARSVSSSSVSRASVSSVSSVSHGGFGSTAHGFSSAGG
ncbi:DUF1190 domain-containing protein [Herbaspirillum sp. RV1423]|uniref:DUF1190 domain-containing protein n=1 Tax=Herbaspirillum sp. RV1423 TaxID=1443993 RepID=UPI00358F4897